MEIYREILGQLLDRDEIYPFIEGLKLGINPNGRLKKGDSLVSRGVTQNKLDLVKLLLDFQADLDITPSSLTDAQILSVARLIPRIHYPNLINNLMIAAVQPTPDKLIDYLSIPGVKVAGQDKTGQTALQYALKYERWPNVYLLAPYFPSFQLGLRPKYLAWKAAAVLPVIRDKTAAELRAFVTRITQRPPQPFVSPNFPLMDQVLTQPRLNLAGQIDLYERNNYGKTILDAMAFYNKPEIRKQLWPLYLVDLRTRTDIDGPLLLRVIEVNGVPCLLWGEIHLDDNRASLPGSLPVEYFLQGLFTLGPQQMDFFLESTTFQHNPSPKKKRASRYKFGESPLTGLIYEYFTCSGVQKEGCENKYPTTRIHNVEIRRQDDPQYNLDGLKEGMLSSKIKLDDYLNELYRIYEGLLDDDFSQVSHAILEIMQLKETSAEGQVYSPDNLRTKTSLARIAKQFQQVPLRLRRAVRQVLLDNYETRIREEKLSPYLLIEFGAGLNDAYTLLRMIKAIYVYQTKLVTFYGGLDHTTNLNYMLKKLGDQVKYKEIASFGLLDLHPQETYSRYKLRHGPALKPAELNIDLPPQKWNEVVDLIEVASQN